ncbi:MAG: type I restriction endonuclease subunit R, partial [Thermomicrobiales bacterium]
GKSLTMVFLVRKLRTLPDLRRFKVVVVTDRTALEQQLSDTAALTGETVLSARNERHLQALLREESPDLVFAMIQKYQAAEGGAEVFDLPRHESLAERMVAEERPPYDGEEEEIERLVVENGDYPILNESEAILVLVDEAHRSHGSLLHANLLRALPECAAIGFTGTPIIMGARQKTHDIFGPFIDRYTIRQSEEDGATVPILYEGRTAPGDVADERSLDQLFEDMFRERTAEELEAIKRKYATTGDVLEAPQLIGSKAADMLRHYVDVVLPNGFKAQVVATSRLAAVRYQQALRDVHAALVADLGALDPSLLALGDEERERRDVETRFLVRAHAHLGTIRRLEFAAVISGNHNDDPSWREWSDPARQRTRIDRFKKPLVHEEPDRQDGLAFVCVQSMLLTGFDAPIEQVLYLDRAMKDHELLQAIARVNRTAAGKSHGLVVDYFGVARHLTEALAVYSGDEIEGALVSLKDELPKLEDRHRRVLAVFRDRGIAEITDIHACVDLLRDVRPRAEFTEKLRLFLESLDIVLPRPEGLSFVRDAKILGFINKAAHNRYRDSQLNLVGAGQKVRQLIDEYVVAQGIDPKIPPISITAAEFPAVVDALPTAKAKASEMEHAARYHISVRVREDPAYYRKLSERLEEILQRFQDNWDELVEALRAFTEEVREGPPADGTGLDPRTQAPFLRILAEAAGQRDATADGLRDLAEATVEIVEHIRQEVRLTDFWSRPNAQNVLRQWIIEFLDKGEIVPFQRARAVADEMVQLAKYRHVDLAA